MMKRFTCWCIAVCLLLGLMPATTLRAEAATYSGSCGENLSWSLDTETGILTISGSGAMTNYSYSSSAPWYLYSNIKTITIAHGVKSIGDLAFYDCDRLTSVTIPDSVTSIGGSAFFSCTDLASVTIPDSVTSIGHGAFHNCYRLASVTIGDSVTSIGHGAFYNCYHLASVTIPDSVTSIGDSAFYSCDSLTSVTIPDSVTSIGYSVFASCDSLTSITILNTECKISEYTFGNPSFTTIYGYAGSTAESYAAKYGYSFHEICVDHNLSHIEAVAPTCTTWGNGEYWYCDVCDLYFADAEATRLTTYAESAALGHSYEAVVTAPTCTEGGYTTYTCSACSERYVADEVAATGHSFEDGNCSVCGEEDPDYLPENPFVDVKESDYFFTPVLWAVQKGITNGISATEFGPNNNCTRGQIVTFLWRACGSPEPTKTDNPFTDVKPADYYYKAVLWAVESGITNGMSATTFEPEATCTRGQVATFLWRSQGKPAPESDNNPFVDVKTSEYYYDAVLWAVENNITNGTGADTFSPDASCTRGQIVTFLYRALAK